MTNYDILFTVLNNDTKEQKVLLASDLLNCPPAESIKTEALELLNSKKTCSYLVSQFKKTIKKMANLSVVAYKIVPGDVGAEYCAIDKDGINEAIKQYQNNK